MQHFTIPPDPTFARLVPYPEPDTPPDALRPLAKISVWLGLSAVLWSPIIAAFILI